MRPNTEPEVGQRVPTKQKIDTSLIDGQRAHSKGQLEKEGGLLEVERQTRTSVIATRAKVTKYDVFLMEVVIQRSKQLIIVHIIT